MSGLGSRCGSVPVTLPAQDLSVDLRAVTVRPTWGAQEHRRWDRLVAEHHWPAVSRRHRQRPAPCRGARRDLARTDRLAARRVQAGRTRSLDRLAGGAAVPAPASRHPDAWPGLGLAGAGAEPAAAVAGHPHGYPVFLAETFVDVSRFVGTCYRASNWRLGLTRGFAREPGRWRHHGQQGDLRVRTDRRRRRGAEPDRGRTLSNTPSQWRRRGCAACSSVWARCPSAAVSGQARSGDRRRCPSGRLPRCERVRPVRRPASRSSSRQWVRSGARASSATPSPQSPPSTTSSPRCRPRPWTTPSVSGPASTARHMRLSPWTGRTCEVPRSRPKTGAG